jgi:hypothetical protein
MPLDFFHCNVNDVVDSVNLKLREMGYELGFCKIKQITWNRLGLECKVEVDLNRGFLIFYLDRKGNVKKVVNV